MVRRSFWALRRLATLVAGVALVAAAGAHALAMDDDRALALSALREVEASPASAELAREPLARAHEALARAERLREVRDETRARLCDGLARRWAETARDVVSAAKAEERARAARLNALDASAQVERERASLEEGLGQTGRLKAQLAALEGESKRPDRTSSVAKDAREADAGAPKRPPTKAPA
ncbi:MAG TPA: hypothetical protein PK141_22505, partial [Polyangiaceae bacterium]|nr:hypothetical protein [Polyangiaceae bacterium]